MKRPKFRKREFTRLFALILLLGLSSNLLAQITVNVEKTSLRSALKQIEHASEYKFFFNESLKELSNQVSFKFDDASIEQVMQTITADNALTYKMEKDNVIVIMQKENKPTVAQKVTGAVFDEAGEPIIGASVLVKGTMVGTITDMDGNFTIDAPEKSKITVTYIGYTATDINANDQKALAHIVLQEDSKMIDEVVVVGYGTQKKVNLTGALTSISMDDVKGSRPLVNVSSALQGAVPGLLVSTGSNEPGTGKSFQLRGAFTVGTGSSGSTIAPLVLIDNVEGDIDMLNPEDIENITVLKDAASTAIYGARAAGGVILVTTKKPREKTAFRLNYNNNFAIGKVVNTPKQAPFSTTLKGYMEAYGDNYFTYTTPSASKWLEYLEQYKANPSAFKTVGDGIFVDEDGKMYFLNEHDTYANFMENSFQQTHNISASGGTEKLRYRISGAILDNDGILVSNKDTYRRFNLNSFIAADIAKWFTQEVTVSYAQSKRQKPQSGIGSMFGSLFLNVTPEGNMPESVCTAISKDTPFYTPRNQVLNAAAVKYNVSNPRLMLKSIIKPFKKFETVFEYTYDKNVYNQHFYSDYIGYINEQGGPIYNVAQNQDYLEKTHSFTNYNAINLYGTYSLDFADNHFKFMAGYNQEYSYYESLYSKAYGMMLTDVPSLSGGTGKLQSTDSYNEYAIRGGFFRVNYNYNDTYLLEVNGRYDGSSKFPRENRFGFFPSVSAGWNVAQEKFMESTRNVVDMLKLRGSYGAIGNQNVSNYAFFPTLDLNNLYNGWLSDGKEVSAITSLPSLVSSTFTWEKVYTMDFGIDINLFNNRFTTVFDWYQKDTKGMLAPGMQLPSVIGADAPWQNTADMRTRGWELSLNWRDRINELNYRIGFNLSDSQSEITKYKSNDASKLLSTFYTGQKLGDIWGYVTDGFYTVDDFEDTKNWKLKEGVTSIKGFSPRPGDIKFVNLRDDATSTNQIDAGVGTLENPGDRKVIGNNLPRYIYGINLGVNYKGFDLNVFMQGTGRRDAWISNNLLFPFGGNNQFSPIYDGLDDYWQPVDYANGDYTAVNANAKYPRIYNQNGGAGSNYRVSDRYLSDASYFRIKNITLAYNVPAVWVKKISFTQMKAFMSIENVATFDKLPNGIDAETLSWSYPTSRVFSFGINVTL